MTKPRVQTGSDTFARDVGKALRRSALRARKIARMYGTPIYVERNGKVVAVRP